MAYMGGSKLRRQLGSSKLQVDLSAGMHEGEAAPWHASPDGLLSFTAPAALPGLIAPADGDRAGSRSTQEKLKSFKSFRRMFSVRQRKSPAVPSPAATSGSPDHPLGEAWRRDLSFFRFDDYLPEDGGMTVQEPHLRTKGRMPTQARGVASSESERKRASKGERRKTTKGSRRVSSPGTGAAESQSDGRIPFMPLQYGGGISLQADGRMPLEHNGRMPLEHNGRMPLEHNGRMPLEHNGRMPLAHNGRMPLEHSGMTPLEHNGRVPQQYEGRIPGYYDGNMASDYERMMALQYDGRILSQYDGMMRLHGDRKKIRQRRRPSERSDRV